jgi:hypothetical protein
MTPSGPALDALHFRAAPPTRPDRLRWIAIPLILLIHWGALEVLRSPPWRPTAAADTVLEVVFIASTSIDLPPPPAWPEAPPRPASRGLTATFRTETARLPAAPPAVVDPPGQPPAPRLFADDGQLRLPTAPPAAPDFARPRSDARRFGERIDTLPGSDRPLAEIGTVVRVPPSPEQRVKQIAAFIGLARPPTDDCRAVERRMLAETNAVARAIARETYERRCRGWR